jgi:anti-anti-sigma factor
MAAAEGVNVDARQDVVVAEVVHKLVDSENCQEMHAALDVARERNLPLILDFGHVMYMSSMAIGVLLSMHKEMARLCKPMILASVRPALRSVLATMLLDKVLDMSDTMDQALARATANQ